MFLEALAQTHRVSLLVVPLHNSRTPSADAHIARHCAEVFVVEPQVTQLGGAATQPGLVRLLAGQTKACAAAIGARTFDVIQAQRIYTAPLALGLAHTTASGRARLHLDLDDRESVTHARIADLLRHNLKKAASDHEAAEAAAYTRAEQELLPRFERIYVCSTADAEAVTASVPSSAVRVVPNALRPPLRIPERLTTHPFRFLFVGSLNYYPNEDAVRFFCTEVVPLLRRLTDAPFQVRVVGTGLSDALMPLTRIPEVRLVGAVGDLAPEYGEADAVVVPVRAGGGTRIKVLEAFAYRRPVVSTTLGIEGIEADPGVDYLRGDSPEELATQCARLMQESGPGADLAAHAASVFEERYSQRRINQLIADQV